MIAYYSINFILIWKSFQQFTFNKKTVSGKNFKAESSVVYCVAVTKDIDIHTCSDYA